MDELRDPAPIARQAVLWAWIWMAGEIVSGLSGLGIALGFPPGADPGNADPSTLPGRLLMGMGVSMVASFALLIVSATVSGIWIYRMSAVKRVMAGAPSMTPGWAVGWFFVPLANLFKPFDGIREGWQVAHAGAEWDAESTPPLLRVWWALWLCWGILQNIIGRLDDALVLTGWLLALSAVLAMPLAFAWTRIVREITQMQTARRSAEAFR